MTLKLHGAIFTVFVTDFSWYYRNTHINHKSLIISSGLGCEMWQFHLRAHIFKSQMRVVKFLMKENVNVRVKLTHLTKFTITHYFSHILRQIIRYLCPTWHWPPWIKNILLLNYALKWKINAIFDIIVIVMFDII